MDCWGGVAAKLYKGIPHPDQRKVPRPSYDQLMKDLGTMSYCAVGRKYGVSDNAIRKWVRWYEEGGEVGSHAEGGDEPMADAA
jgi:Helix-turn-helix domain